MTLHQIGGAMLIAPFAAVILLSLWLGTRSNKEFALLVIGFVAFLSWIAAGSYLLTSH